jgi:hypothetical protein
MNNDSLQKAINEAKRFLQMAKLFQERAKTDKYAFFGTKEGGAVRRASLDLTRSLAEMRKC